MKNVLVLGAGRSSPYLIHHLLRTAQRRGWFVTVGDLDVEAARGAVGGHPCGDAVRFDINDAALRAAQIEKADAVIYMLAPQFQDLVAWDCVSHGRHMLSVSYEDRALRDLDRDAHRRGVLLLSELGLDPGLDHMSAMAMINRVHDGGGRIVGFTSYGSGIPAPNQPTNPLRYAITWNPRNVVMAAEHGAQYMERGKIKILPWHRVFDNTWPVEVPGIGVLEAYANRESLSYMEAFGLEHVTTMIRGTLRYPGWSETWAKIVELGLPNEELRIPRLAERTYAEVLEMFLPGHGGGALDKRLAAHLGISATGRTMEHLKWLGLLSDEPIGCEGQTPAAMMIHVLQRKLPLEPGQRDMVILQHELIVEPADDGSGALERHLSTLVAEGGRDGFSAMARTVGLPTAVATELLLEGEIALTGSQIPTHPSIYVPILREVQREGLVFSERVESMQREGSEPSA